jgi:nucleotide-binding universal stress UspA family protein
MIRKILVTTDGSDHAKRAIAYAGDIASKYEATLYLVHVISFSHSTALAGRHLSEAGMGTLRKQIKRAGEDIIREAEAAARTQGIKRIEAFLLEGDPASEILSAAKRYDVDAIVLGSRGAGMLGKLMLGSVSDKVCHLADRTCITVK